MAIGVIANDKKNKLHSSSTNKYYDPTFSISLDDENESHAIIANNIKPNSIVLDIGCAQGMFGELLSKQFNCKVYAIELDKEAIKIAEKTNCYQKIYNFDISDKQNPNYKQFFEADVKFDYIIFSDVLEHLLYPDKVLYEFSKKLKHDGSILISLPNIAHYDVIDGLLNEKFNYSEMGILDNTHLRFFTKYSFAEYVKSINEDKNYTDFNFELEVIGKTVINPSFYGQYENLDRIITANPQLFVLQNIFKLTKKKDNEKTLSLNNILSEERKNLTKIIDDELVNYVQKLDDCELQIASLKKELNSLNCDHDLLLKKNEQLQLDLNSIYNSKSWVVTKPLRKMSEKIGIDKHTNNYKTDKKKSVLYILQSWLDIKNLNNTHIGGTTLHVLDLIKKMQNDYNVYVLTTIDNKYVLITFENGEQIIRNLNVEVKIYRYDGYHYAFLNLIYKLIDKLQIDFVHIQHIINFPCDLQYISRKAKVILTLHDYTIVCPNYFLLDENDKYCLEATSEKCLSCSKGLDLKTRNMAINNLLKSVDKIFVPDLSVMTEVQKYYNYDKFEIIPNGIDNDSFSKFEYCDKKPGKIKNIAFVGGLNTHKGSKLAKEIIENNNSNIMYHLFGTSKDNFFLKDYTNYKYHGEYHKNDLPKLLNDNHIDLVLMLSICPESFCYVLSETVYSKTPVIALDIGAIGNRVKQMDIGLVLKYDINYRGIIESFDKVFEKKIYDKYLKNLEKATVPTIDGMVKSIIEIYDNISVEDRPKDYYSINKFIKKFKIKYKIKGLE